MGGCIRTDGTAFETYPEFSTPSGGRGRVAHYLGRRHLVHERDPVGETGAADFAEQQTDDVIWVAFRGSSRV